MHSGRLLYNGPFQIDNDEVADAKFIGVHELVTLVNDPESNITPWFRSEAQHLLSSLLPAENN
jgi:isopentenyldiphosphate isomerase